MSASGESPLRARRDPVTGVLWPDATAPPPPCPSAPRHLDRVASACAHRTARDRIGGMTTTTRVGAVWAALLLSACTSGAGDPPATDSVAPVTSERAVLAGGCFWGMEEIVRKIPGVLSTRVGYTGGRVPDATYDVVKTGRSGHAEALEVVFDPAVLTYEDLLERWFFRMHDPTTLNRQGNDVGTQYRSAIFYTSEAQRVAAEAVKARVDASGKWPAPIVTEVVAAGPFYAAEDYHQKYLQKNPRGYTCHFLRD
ncbi:MAG: peptide-methionine (S)-S-oxide reductase MsrA [Planctomycetes bacterium]|nr:peptide-methionine (S)-S-oxide reductase MsrA [Planctomycetota bacterium]